MGSRARPGHRLAAVCLSLGLTALGACAASRGRAASADGCPPPARIGAVPAPRVRSLLPALRAWEGATIGADSAERVRAFRVLVMETNPDLFGPVFPMPTDAALAGYVAWLGPRLAATHRIGALLERRLPDAVRRVATLFPASASQSVDVVVGAGFMSNGTVRMVGGRPVLFLGPDVQTLVSEREEDADIVLDHELVHVAHARVNPAVYARVDSSVRRRPAPLYASIFAERLATWATGCTAPGRSEADRLLSPTLAQEAAAAAPRLLPALAAELESTDVSRFGDWFFVGGRPTDIPPRFAYWAGDRLVAALAADHRPEALLRLDAAAVLVESRAALARVRAGLPAAP